MNSEIKAISASREVTPAASLPEFPLPQQTTTSTQNAPTGDTVHLSPAAQQLLGSQQLVEAKSSEAESSDAERAMIEQLVRAAAAGDVGALGLLTIA